MRMTRSLALLALLSVATQIQAQKPGEYGNMRAITSSRLKAHLEFIASDELEGRATPSRGLDTAAKYLAAQLSLWGLKPGGDDGTYFQKFPLKRPSVNGASTTLNLGSGDLKYGEGFYARAAAGTAEGELAYVGYGWHRPGSAEDPYAKVNVKGKLILILDGRPAWLTNEMMESGAALSPAEAAIKLGATGILFVSNGSDTFWADNVKRSIEPRFTMLAMPGEDDGERLPYAVVRPTALESLLADEPLVASDLKRRMDAKEPGDAFALKSGKRVKLVVAASDNLVYTQNVIAIAEGTDPKMKSEYVAVGAHYDHVGMREQGTGDKIFNGADDDGSGTVAVLEIAHALATGPKPKRSTVFIWHAGEERGLWGSRYFVVKPTVPIKQVVAQLNLDMIGRSRPLGDTKASNKMLIGPNGIYLVGATRMSTELGKMARDVNDKLYKLTYDPTYDALDHPERIFFRSDHYSYAEQGIPILFWFDGVHEDYHKVSDHVDKIDFPKMEKIARTVFATTWEVANRKSRPVVDMPLPKR